MSVHAQISHCDSHHLDTMYGSAKKHAGLMMRLEYKGKDANEVYTNPPGAARNGLKENGDGSWTETCPDGFLSHRRGPNRLHALCGKSRVLVCWPDLGFRFAPARVLLPWSVSWTPAVLLCGCRRLSLE